VVIIETPIFTNRVLTLLSEEQYRLFQAYLLNNPEAGKVIPGSGGLRKLRWAAKGHGKSGGLRIIYYWFISRDTILLLFAYSKNERDDLTPEQIRQLGKVIEGEYV
jgi:mRNA-degrading endonuclease RelE of RelBE toxin-antitoxin system